MLFNVLKNSFWTICPSILGLKHCNQLSWIRILLQPFFKLLSKLSWQFQVWLFYLKSWTKLGFQNLHKIKNLKENRRNLYKFLHPLLLNIHFQADWKQLCFTMDHRDAAERFFWLQTLNSSQLIPGKLLCHVYDFKSCHLGLCKTWSYFIIMKQGSLKFIQVIQSDDYETFFSMISISFSGLTLHILGPWTSRMKPLNYKNTKKQDYSLNR